MNGLNTINANAVFTDTLEVNTLQIDTKGTAPTRPLGDNTTNIATTAFVNGAVTGAFVTLNTTQTITGEKTLSNANTFITGNTVTDSIQSSAVGTTQNIGTTQTSGILNVGTLGARSGAININTGATTTAPVNISTASTSFNTVSIGSASSAVTIAGVSTFTNSTPSAFTFGLTSSKVNPSAVGGLLTIGDTQTTGILGIGGLPARSGRIDINVGGTSTAPVNISSGTNANAPITIGSTLSTTQTATHNALTTFSKKASFQGNVNLDGTGRIETTTNDMTIAVAAGNTISFVCGSLSTLSMGVGSNLFQGNCRVAAPAILQLEGMSSGYRMYYVEFDKYAYFTGYGVDYLGMKFLNTSGTQQLEITDTAITATTNMITNGNLTVGKPILPSYVTTSSYSETSAATVLTQINGTFRSTVSWSNWATGVANYIFNRTTAVAGWTNGGTQGSGSGGYFSCPAGVYQFFMAYSFDDGTAYNLTDLQVGLFNSNALTAGSTQAAYIAATMGTNLTCYKHDVTTQTPAATDIYVSQMSGTFRITAATNLYPYARINNAASGGINTVNFDLSITRIG
jgi:hypothetical protein